ncbi:hypothetical protein CDL12_17427 [Handroanthus impetiginosus]|uniref:F-box domain-containing protein n=1 Tax=Handroanthus impetiginosus TaxID=429701 RepID=A0A2G9GXK0_9LAMI|nr:hypothetical protein CDL12_17427 [Handroanthus impetiginosus]
MKQKPWPSKSDNPHFPPLPFIKKHNNNPTLAKPLKIHFSYVNSTRKHPSSSSSSSSPDFSAIPYDVLARIAASFSLANLRAASLVCRAWRDALKPLREAMVLLKWGKRFKHGRGGVKPNLSKALDSFLKGAARGSTLAMVDAGLIFWEMGKKDEAIAWYRRAAELGDPAGQCNLAISYLQANPPNSKEAIEWLYKASIASHVRAQYQLARCLHEGQGVEQSLEEAARWYLRAAEGGYVRAMYNTSLCYSLGEGLWQSHRLARKWMKRAADCGHSRAQYDHGLTLVLEGDTMKALVYLELATRAGEMAATHIKNDILHELSAASRDKAMHLADNWRPLPSSR